MATKYLVSGSTDWSDTASWSDGIVPGNGDTVYLENSSQDIDTGLAQSGVTLAKLEIDRTFTGNLGTSTTYLVINATTLNIGTFKGTGSPAGSGRLKINGTFTTVNVYTSAASGTDTNMQPVRLLGTITTANVYSGIVGFATTITTESCTVTSLNMLGAGGVVTMGVGAALTNLNQVAGTFSSFTPPTTLLNISAGTATFTGSGNCTAMNNKGGTITHNGTGTVTTFNSYAGASYLNSTGTLGTLNLLGGTTSFLLSNAARTVTNIYIYAGAILDIDPSVVTVTNGIRNSSNKLRIKGTAAA